MSHPKNIRLFVGNANPPLGNAICELFALRPAPLKLDKFPDLEIQCKIEDDVRGSDAFIIQPTCPPVNDSLMELLIMIDCLRRASAERITAVVPYFGYARQDRKDEGRVPITAKLVANLITKAGADRVLTMDLHAAQIQGFFDIPVDHLGASQEFYDHYRKLKIPDLTVLAPDVGSSKRAGHFSRALNAPLAVVDKRRLSPTEVRAVNVIGTVDGRNVLIPDDMISTAGTLVTAVETAREHGAKDIYICATHALLSGPAVQRLNGLPIKELAFTDTIPLNPMKAAELKNYTVLSVARLLKEAIRRIHTSESISILFDTE
ncbi:MAG: ribose-phosphate diphosphokinase [Planctomycetota bacterium]